MIYCRMKLLLWLFLICAPACAAWAQSNDDTIFFHSSDSLASRDEYGLVHQSGVVYPTDTAPRHGWRLLYYLRVETNW